MGRAPGCESPGAVLCPYHVPSHTCVTSRDADPEFQLPGQPRLPCLGFPLWDDGVYGYLTDSWEELKTKGKRAMG